MSEYIEREAAVAKIIELINQSGKYTDYECGADDACYIVNHTPAADVRPVVRGEWDDKPVAFFLKCSECGCCVANGYDVFLDRGELNYCPNCGADMKEKNEDEKNKT